MDGEADRAAREIAALRGEHDGRVCVERLRADHADVRASRRDAERSAELAGLASDPAVVGGRAGDRRHGAGRDAEANRAVKGVISEPHIQTTNQLISVLSSCSEKDKGADSLPKAQLPEDDDSGQEDCLPRDHNNKAVLDTPMIMQACPEFATWARDIGESLRNWGDLHRAASQLRPMIGVPQRTWDIAQDCLGKQVATAALALIFEKYCTGEVASPGGYLSGMVKKGRAGELHLERSFYGRLNA